MRRVPCLVILALTLAPIAAEAQSSATSRRAIVADPDVQADLKLDDRQKAALKRWIESAGKPPAPPVPKPGAAPQDAPSDLDFAAVGRTLTAKIADDGEALATILTPAQQTRLEQIGLQLDGASALARPEVASALALNDAQTEAIRAILDAAAAARRDALESRGAARPGAAPLDVLNAIDDRAEQAARRVLSRRQRERFAAILGRPLHPAPAPAQPQPGAGR